MRARLRRIAVALTVAVAASSVPASAGSAPAITVFENTLAPVKPIQSTLQHLGLQSTYRTESAPFEADLASGLFDVAIVNSTNADISHLATEIRTFLLEGGRVLMFLYNIDGRRANGLWQTMGANYEADIETPPAAIEILEPSHPIFVTPHLIGTITAGGGDPVGDNGDFLRQLSRGMGLARGAGFTDDEHLLIVARRDGRSILNAFLPGDYLGDPDMVNLLENEVIFVVEGIHAEDFEVDPTPFDSVFTPVRCTGCLSNTDYSGGVGSPCYCDNGCLSFGDCCYDACQLCGRCAP